MPDKLFHLGFLKVKYKAAIRDKTMKLRKGFLTNWRQMFVVCLLLVLCGRLIKAQEFPILVYHRFDSAMPGLTTVRTSTFELQLEWLEDHHYQILSLRTVTDKLRTMRDTNAPAVAITVDDGHRSIYAEMFPLILKHHIPVTLFIYPSVISNASYALTWEQIRQMKRSGLVDVQSHTLWHPNFRKERARLSDAEYEAFVIKQLTRSKDILSSRLGGQIDSLAWPFGIHNSYLENAAQRAGYKTAFALGGAPARAGGNMLAIPRIPVSDNDTGARFYRLLMDPRRNRREK
ncbi:polysaccharide deacetylase family protein [Edaphobacter paludis]|uniref:Polysaccharide deacetylase family protein n=1 Tax=Edaphobacter paludis TaxID=3035702 RepID=A0AAU7D2X2_9BACT